MTVETTDSRVQYETNGTTGPWTVPFYFLADADLQVIYTDSSGAETTLVLTTNYSVTGASVPSGGTVTTVTAYPAGGTITISNEVEALQEVDYTETDAFPAETHERALDRLTMLAQRAIRTVARALKIPASDNTDMSLPGPASRAERVLGFDSDGKPIMLTRTDDGGSALALDLASTSDASKGAGMVGYILDAIGAVATTVRGWFRREIWVQDFMTDAERADGFGTAATIDNTAAFQAAITHATGRGNKTIHAESGRDYKITGELINTQGVMIVFEGSQGSTQSFGASITHYSNGNLFTWNGNGVSNKGTGGGLKNVLLVKANGYSGGVALNVVATDDNHRPGEMVFENILGYGLGTGRWTRGMVVDGSACNTPGARGVRTLNLRKVRFADVTTANETIVINQVSHFYAHGLSCDTGSGSAAGITIKGINDGIYLNATGCAGTVTIVANDASNATTNVVIDGKVGGSFTNNDTACNGTVNLANSGGGIANKSKSLKIIADNAPEFLAVRTTAAADVTGDGTVYQVAFDNEVFDTLGNFGTNVFTCTVAGKYHFAAGITYKDLAAAHTRSDIALVKTGAPTRAITDTTNPYAQSITGGYATRHVSATLDLAYGETVYLTANVSGGTKVIDVYGSAGTDYTWFSGKYIP